MCSVLRGRVIGIRAAHTLFRDEVCSWEGGLRSTPSGQQANMKGLSRAETQRRRELPESEAGTVLIGIGIWKSAASPSNAPELSFPQRLSASAGERGVRAADVS